MQVEQATRSTNKSLQRLVNKLGTKPEDIYAALCKQTVDLVFTAHPTQVSKHMLLSRTTGMPQPSRTVLPLGRAGGPPNKRAAWRASAARLWVCKLR